MLDIGAHQAAIHSSRDVALADIADSNDIVYDHARRHNRLGGVSPEEHKAAHKRGRRRARAQVGYPTLHEGLGTPTFTPETSQLHPVEFQTARLTPSAPVITAMTGALGCIMLKGGTTPVAPALPARATHHRGFDAYGC